MAAGKVCKVSPGPEPFKGIPIRPSSQLPGPGEVLIRYEVELAGCCELNMFGWCCFGCLLCTALPISWLPFVCSSCKSKFQRPVYGYPMHSMAFSAAADNDREAVHKAQLATPTIHCMDVALEQAWTPCQPLHDQCNSSERPASHPGHTHPVLLQRSNPSPPPMSIFVPPSAVPACGFTPDNPFPSRYSPVMMMMSAKSSPTKPNPSMLSMQHGVDLGGCESEASYPVAAL